VLGVNKNDKKNLPVILTFTITINCFNFGPYSIYIFYIAGLLLLFLVMVMVYIKNHKLYKADLFKISNIPNFLNFLLMPAEFLSSFIKQLIRDFLILPANHLGSKVVVNFSWAAFLMTIVSLSEKIIKSLFNFNINDTFLSLNPSIVLVACLFLFISVL
jgi:heme exporter protein D